MSLAYAGEMQIARPGQSTTRYGHRAATLRRWRKRFTTGGAMQVKDVKIHTLWRTTFEQYELISRGPLDCRLRLWINGVLVVDEEVFDWAAATSRARRAQN